MGAEDVFGFHLLGRRYRYRVYRTMQGFPHLVLQIGLSRVRSPWGVGGIRTILVDEDVYLFRLVREHWIFSLEVWRIWIVNPICDG